MECSEMEFFYLDEWSTKLTERLGKKRYPISGLFELTDRCNLKCIHCYIRQTENCKKAKADELTTEQVKNILKQAADAGVLFITFTGGEVFVRNDFLEIFKYARSLGILTTIFTNGTLITPEIADALKEYAASLVEITLYGATDETYEKITGIKGSYNRCIKGLDLLIEREIPLKLKTILLSPNIHELPLMRAFAAERNLPFRYDGLLWPRIDSHLSPVEYQLSAKELVEVDEQDPERIREWRRVYDQFSGAIRSEYVFSCGAGLRSFHINSQGKMSICTMVREPAYDLKEMSFIEAFEKLGDLRNLTRKQNNKCRTCTLGALCAQCPGWSQSVHGDLETPVDFLCEVAHLRANLVKESIIKTSIQEEL